MRRALGVLALVCVTACNGGGGVDVSDSATTETTPLPVFTGDADSPFCQVTRSFADEQAPDPLADGLDPVDVQIEMRAAVLRVERLLDAAPPEIVDDVTTVYAGLLDIDNLLAEYDYDFIAVSSAGISPDTFDDPAYAAAGGRVAKYQADVCNAEQ